MFSATNRIGTGTEPRIRAAEKIQFDESTVYGYQTSYVLGEIASQRKGFETYVGIVQADIRTLRRFVTDARYRTELATIVEGVNGFLNTDRAIWRDVKLGTPAAKAAAANLTLNAEATAYNSMLNSAAAYLNHAQGVRRDRPRRRRDRPGRRSSRWAAEGRPGGGTPGAGTTSATDA